MYHAEAMRIASNARPPIGPEEMHKRIDAGLRFALLLRNFHLENGAAGISLPIKAPDGVGQSAFLFTQAVTNNVLEGSLADQLHHVDVDLYALCNARTDTFPECQHVVCTSEGWWETFTDAVQHARAIIVVCDELGPGLEQELIWIGMESERARKTLIIEFNRCLGRMGEVAQRVGERTEWRIQLDGTASMPARLHIVTLPSSFLDFASSKADNLVCER